MDPVRKHTVVEEDGQLIINGLPYKKGDHVEVILQKENGSYRNRGLSARKLLASPLIGLWADREDIGDSSEFSRGLREKAQHRQDRE
jgi:hypothetical protein